MDLSLLNLAHSSQLTSSTSKNLFPPEYQVPIPFFFSLSTRYQPYFPSRVPGTNPNFFPEYQVPEYQHPDPYQLSIRFHFIRYFPSLPFESLTVVLLMCDHQVNSYFSGVKSQMHLSHFSPAFKEVKARQRFWAAS